MRRGDLDKLRRLDPALARQLEGVLERKAAPEAPGEGSCAAPEASAGHREPHQRTVLVGTPLPASKAPSVAEAPSETPLSVSEPPGCSSAQPRLARGEDAREADSRACAEPAHTFTDASAQVGLPEVPQVLVSTEASAEQKLAELWEGYEDDCVPEDELERRRAERAAEREAQRARDRAHSAALGFFPGAHFRRRGTGKHVSCEQLELQLDGIEKRAGRASTWTEGHAAVQTMADVEAQCFGVRELGDRPDSMPAGLRGMFPGLTKTQWALLRVVVTAYMGGALGVYEYQPILASDLDMSERALRYSLNGGKDRPPGLVELGLVKRRQTWKAGVGERPSDHHYLLLQAGPALVEVLLPLMCMSRAKHGHRIPRRSGYTRTSARRSAAAARQAARRTRYEAAERVVRRRQGEVELRQSDAPRERREVARKPASTAKFNCPAQNADNPVPPPSGEGGLRVRRGRPPSPPCSNVSLRDETLAPGPPPPLNPNVSDSLPPKTQLLGDRARALDVAAQPTPDLDYWRRRKKRGGPVPDEIDALLLREQFSALGGVIWG